jgi:hypothetical protein
LSIIQLPAPSRRGWFENPPVTPVFEEAEIVAFLDSIYANSLRDIRDKAIFYEDLQTLPFPEVDPCFYRNPTTADRLAAICKEYMKENPGEGTSKRKDADFK